MLLFNLCFIYLGYFKSFFSLSNIWVFFRIIRSLRFERVYLQYRKTATSHQIRSSSNPRLVQSTRNLKRDSFNSYVCENNITGMKSLVLQTCAAYSWWWILYNIIAAIEIYVLRILRWQRSSWFSYIITGLYGPSLFSRCARACRFPLWRACGVGAIIFTRPLQRLGKKWHINIFCHAAAVCGTKVNKGSVGKMVLKLQGALRWIGINSLSSWERFNMCTWKMERIYPLT